MKQKQMCIQEDGKLLLPYIGMEDVLVDSYIWAADLAWINHYKIHKMSLILVREAEKTW